MTDFKKLCEEIIRKWDVAAFYEFKVFHETPEWFHEWLKEKTKNHYIFPLAEYIIIAANSAEVLAKRVLALEEFILGRCCCKSIPGPQACSYCDAVYGEEREI